MAVLFWQIDLLNGNPTRQKQIELGIESLGAFCGVYLTYIIFLRSRDDLVKQDRERIERKEKRHKTEINVLIKSSENQIEAFRQIINEQSRVLIEALEKNNQDSSDKEAARAIERTYQLSKLDYEIEKLELELLEEKDRLAEIEEFEWFRPPSVKEEQKAEQLTIIKAVQSKIEDLKRKRSNL